jgi:hypothetical protein
MPPQNVSAAALSCSKKSSAITDRENGRDTTGRCPSFPASWSTPLWSAKTLWILASMFRREINMVSQAEIKEQWDRWTEDHRAIAQAEGWDMFDYDCRGLLQIQRCDEAEVFGSDQEVIDLLETKASSGDATAILALEIDKFFEPIIYPELAAPVVEVEPGTALKF